jgi:hypothetical protein
MEQAIMSRHLTTRNWEGFVDENIIGNSSSHQISRHPVRSLAETRWSGIQTIVLQYPLIGTNAGHPIAPAELLIALLLADLDNSGDTVDMARETDSSKRHETKKPAGSGCSMPQ